MKRAKLIHPAPAGSCGARPRTWIVVNPAIAINRKHFRTFWDSCRPTLIPCNVSDKNSQSNGSVPDEDIVWQSGAFPQYMQPNPVGVEFCANLEDAKAKQGIVKTEVEHSTTNSSLWRSVHRETAEDAKAEPLLSSSLYASILSHETFEHSLAFVLANRLSDTTLLSTELFELFYNILRGSPGVSDAAIADLCAVRERDPACTTYAQALLYYKGYHAIQVQRIAHELWQKNRKVMALALQSRSSEVFGVDIHPAAKIGKGVLLDHGTGVVIGETAQIGNNVSILQNVTLGGTGKEHGDRHPKISDNVLIGASATILGNILIGKGAQVAAGSLVLKPVPPRTMVAGTPAREVGLVTGNPALKMDQWGECTDSSSDEEHAYMINKKKHPADEPITYEEAEAAIQVTVDQESYAEKVANEQVNAGVEDQKQGKKKVAGKGRRGRSSSQPVETDAVEAVTDDEEAKKKWGKDGKEGKEDMEYFI